MFILFTACISFYLNNYIKSLLTVYNLLYTPETVFNQSCVWIFYSWKLKIPSLKGDPILGAFLHKILAKVLLMNSLDVSTLFVNQNMSYLWIKMRLQNINTYLDFHEVSDELQNRRRKLDALYVIKKHNYSRQMKWREILVSLRQRGCRARKFVILLQGYFV